MLDIQTQDLAYLVVEVLYIVTIALLPKAPKIIQILPYLGSRYFHPIAEFLRGNPHNIVLK
jgi:hypothetical protein